MLNTNGLIVDSNSNADLWALMSKNCKKIVVHPKMSTILSKSFRNACMLTTFPCLRRAPILSNFPLPLLPPLPIVDSPLKAQSQLVYICSQYHFLSDRRRSHFSKNISSLRNIKYFQALSDHK